MNEDFAPFELAVKLKEKGFPQHITDEAYITENYGEDEYDIGDRLPIPLIPDYMDDVASPTISQVLKWLRKERKLHIEPCILTDADTDADGKIINEYVYWSFSVTNIENGEMIYFEYEHIDDKRFDSYEQSAVAGIEYVLDNLI